jgi:protein phosphatase
VAGESSTEAKPDPASPPAGDGVRLHLFGCTDVGLVREHNEDSFLLLRLDDGNRELEALRKHGLGARGTLLVVCDGMGGAAAGEVASSLAVESLATTMLDPTLTPPPEGIVDDGKTALGRKLRAATREANMRIYREARENLARSGMGTTMTAVLLSSGHAVIAQVGDSRAYIWRKGAFTQVTRDQSLVNQLLESGHITPEQAKFFEHSNVILQALGVQEDVEVQLSTVELRRGDRFMVCSDGLVGVVTDEEIAEVMAQIDDPEEAAKLLIELANTAGGPDNITVIVAHADGEPLAEPAAEDVVRYELWRIPEAAPEPAAPVTATPDSPTRPMRLAAEAPTSDGRGNGDGAAAAPAAPEPAAPAAAAPAAVAPAAAPAVAAPAPPAAVAAAPAAVVPPPSLPMRELASMAVVVGLVVSSLFAGAALYRRGVACRFDDARRREGLALLVDGRDTGVRTGAGSTDFRLTPGKHVLSLKGEGAPEGTFELEAAFGQGCSVSAGGPAPADPGQ